MIIYIQTTEGRRDVLPDVTGLLYDDDEDDNDDEDDDDHDGDVGVDGDYYTSNDPITCSMSLDLGISGRCGSPGLAKLVRLDAETG